MPHHIAFAQGWELRFVSGMIFERIWRRMNFERIWCGMNLERIWFGVNLEQGHDTGVFLDALFAKLEVLGCYVRHYKPAGGSALE